MHFYYSDIRGMHNIFWKIKECKNVIQKDNDEYVWQSVYEQDVEKQTYSSYYEKYFT